MKQVPLPSTSKFSSVIVCRLFENPVWARPYTLLSAELEVKPSSSRTVSLIKDSFLPPSFANTLHFISKPERNANKNQEPYQDQEIEISKRGLRRLLLSCKACFLADIWLGLPLKLEALSKFMWSELHSAETYEVIWKHLHLRLVLASCYLCDFGNTTKLNQRKIRKKNHQRNVTFSKHSVNVSVSICVSGNTPRNNYFIMIFLCVDSVQTEHCQIPDFVTGCVTLGMFLWSFHAFWPEKNGKKNNPYLAGMLWMLHVIVHVSVWCKILPFSISFICDSY